MPRGAVTAALFLAATLAWAAPAAMVEYQWSSVKVGGGGYSPNVIFSPVAAGLAYLRTDIGGLYRYDEPARGWVPLEDDLAEGSYFGIESVAPDPRDADVVYAAAGMYGSAPAAILRSDTRGASWTIYPVPFRMGGNEDGRAVGERLAVDPHQTRILYFGSRHDGLQSSVDAGRTWTKVTTFPYAGLGPAEPHATHDGISFVVFDARNGADGTPTRTIYVGVADPAQHGVFRSDDAGQTWRALEGEPRPGLLPVRAQLDTHGVLYVSFSNAGGPSGVTAGALFKYESSEGAWSDITPPSKSSVPGGYLGLSLDPAHRGTVLVASIDHWLGGDAIWCSTDGGRTWSNLRGRSRTDVAATPFLRWGRRTASFGWWMTGLAIDPFDAAHVLYTTGATVYETHGFDALHPSRPIRWQPAVTGLEETAVLALASPAKGPHLLSGFGDIGGFVHADLRKSPPSMFLAPVFDNTDVVDTAGLAPNVVVRSGRPQHGDAAAWSNDFGRSWSLLAPPSFVPPATAPAPGGGRHHEQAGTIAVSADGSAFIAVRATASLTRDRGRSWSAVVGLPPFARVVADRVDAQRFYALDTDRGRILASVDGGAHFNALESSGLPSFSGADPAVRIPLVAVPGKAADLWLIGADGLHHSVDGGRNFIAAGGALRATALAFGKAASDGGYPTVFAIGTQGELTAIWRSDDGGASWLRINDAQHEYGRRYSVIAGDPRVYGRVYLGADGRGLLYGEPVRK